MIFTLTKIYCNRDRGKYYVTYEYTAKETGDVRTNTQKMTKIDLFAITSLWKQDVGYTKILVSESPSQTVFVPIDRKGY